MGKLFGTDGIRGVANETLDTKLAYRIGQAAAISLQDGTGRKPTVVIGKDTRISSDMLEAALTEGGQMLDPWGHPYLVTIKKGSASMKTRTVTGALNTGYYLPNYYRISESER